ncbi:MAG: hypothetical protein COZ46_05135 [Verrucomicrobia bacterium CG_4_10_14_3_um_filter_43_23]|nr:MAG: hypothetical protein AUJ82_03885 [Verrucomicrobia bacterium CG1_02_43_26]PIP58490.1 MAG: hypothetical protein COX01_08210 [Verrucomicrobia bacterium CG22_combo_CG10-13_8_21_14_all_43_17]PIX58163.1 MAG: hypothetical protein COZ46_05135 [Verrucomicrobia bacterium CG_4_10_14_3_um_filter_43_23]PIY61151.1 MAG: hypothetical protein COY94_06820 [Verrucomicrobia bacterium CG_4_10_14_0_8_um_filter_43_34]PJA43370.1 MAG: hypothetical protein CO175_08360 [Verrucomicrobia bacterium CG_4_9_14_3_um_fi
MGNPFSAHVFMKKQPKYSSHYGQNVKKTQQARNSIYSTKLIFMKYPPASVSFNVLSFRSPRVPFGL